MESGAARLTQAYMTGYSRDYLIYIFTFFVIAIGGSLFLLNGFTINLSNDASFRFYEVVLILAMMTAAVAIIFARSRLTGLLLIGVLGYGVGLFFVIFHAPDLALTQLIVETVSVALFLLCFYFLPERKREGGKVPFRSVNLAIALSVGTIMTLIALSVQGNHLFEPISVYFENAYELAGAKNIVNAILADFRAFDTMLEIVVLLIVALGVFSLLKLRATGGEKK